MANNAVDSEECSSVERELVRDKHNATLYFVVEKVVVREK